MTLSRPSTMNGYMLFPLARKVTEFPPASMRATSVKNWSLFSKSLSVSIVEAKESIKKRTQKRKAAETYF